MKLPIIRQPFHITIPVAGQQEPIQPVQPIVPATLKLPTALPTALNASPKIQAALAVLSAPKPPPAPVVLEGPAALAIYDAHGEAITLDPDQIRAVNLVKDGQSGVITGNAGVGKTTATQAIFLELLNSDKHYPVSYRIVGTGERWVGPSIACIAATNKAVRNMRRKVLSNPILQELLGEGYNITTAHNLLEYTRTMTYSESREKDVMTFIPRRDATNKLNITHLIVEEASTLSAGPNSMWEKLWAALPEGVQIIFLGDICQLPAIGGKAILSYAVQKLPVVELTTIHRQALENPIIRQAYNCLQGKPVHTDLIMDGQQGVKIMTGDDPTKAVTVLGSTAMKRKLAAAIPVWLDKGLFNPDTDIILCPYNNSEGSNIGTKWINAIVGSELAVRDQKMVYEIRTGFNTIYMAIGDRVMVNKVEGKVLSIATNRAYFGRSPQPPSTSMNYFGELDDRADIETILNDLESSDFDGLSMDTMLEAGSETTDSDEEKGRAASHSVEIELDDGTIRRLNRSGDFSEQNFSLGWAISVHKAQGSEWPRVFVILHDTHRNMLYRELLYTAMTRAEKQLIIVAQQHVIDRCARNPRIKGNSLAAKIEFFNAGYLDQDVPLPTGETR